MAGGLQTRACNGCAAAKRRCGKEAAGCLRCKTRGIKCTYTAAKPARFVLCPGEDVPPVEPGIATYDAALQPMREFSLCPPVRETGGTSLSSSLELSGLTSDFVDDQPPCSWFNSPETWVVRFPISSPRPGDTAGLRRSMISLHGWLVQWVEKGSNPFIHAELYRYRFLRPIQDAYTALTCYVHRTPSSKATVFRIIEDRARQLVAERGSVSPSDSSSCYTSTRSDALDALEHVAQVQALLVYQMIGLYDGDIRLRYLSECHIPVLQKWMKAMVEHARQAVCLGDFIISTTEEKRAPAIYPPDTTQSENLLWHTWILAESIRRTWVIASGIQTIYLMMQSGRTSPCQGGMMFTTRLGVWEAESAASWEKLCLEVNVGLVHMADIQALFTEATPGNVNEFAKVILQILFGVEMLQRWEV